MPTRDQLLDLADRYLCDVASAVVGAARRASEVEPAIRALRELRAENEELRGRVKAMEATNERSIPCS